MSVNGRGDVYIRTITLNHTQARQVENKHILLKRGIIYSQAQAAYVGNQSEQSFQIAAADYCSANCLKLTDIDLSSLYVKAAVSGAIVHILGTLNDQ